MRANVSSRRRFYVAAALLLCLGGCEIGQVTFDGDGDGGEDAQPEYIVEKGYPPGSYPKGDKIVYQGQQYDRQVFKETIVQDNIDNGRYTNVTNNYKLVGDLQTAPLGGSNPEHPGIVRGRGPAIRPGTFTDPADTQTKHRPPTHPGSSGSTDARPMPTMPTPPRPVPVRPEPASPPPTFHPTPSLPSGSSHRSAYGPY